MYGVLNVPVLPECLLHAKFSGNYSLHLRSHLFSVLPPPLTPLSLKKKKMAETKKVKSPQDFASLYILTIILFTR